MPRITMETPHCLGRDEAIQRLKNRFGDVRSKFGTQVTNVHENWVDHTLSFGFKAMGMGVSGTVHVDDDKVKLLADLPMAAMLFKKTIEQQIYKELSTLLA